MNKELVEKYITRLSVIPTNVQPSGQLYSDIKCILFDIYGTLFISASGDIGTTGSQKYNIDLIEKLLQKYGIKESPRDIIKRLHDCISKKHEILKQTGIDYPEVEIDLIWRDVLKGCNVIEIRNFAIEFEFIINPVYPMPNLEKMLAFCREKQIHMGIISNAQFFTIHLFRWLLGAKIDQLGFDRELVFLSYKYGYAKPSRELFSKVIEKLKIRNIELESVLYIGNDMLKDIFPARMSGFKTALFAGDLRSLRMREKNPECVNLVPDIVVTDLIQITDHLK